MGNLVLSTEQYAWLHHELKRLFESKEKQAKTKPAIRKTGEYAAYRDLAKAISGFDPLQVKMVRLQRRQYQLLYALVKAQIKAIDEKLLPGYQEKLQKGEAVQMYIDKATELRDVVLKDVTVKIEEILQ